MKIKYSYSIQSNIVYDEIEIAQQMSSQEKVKLVLKAIANATGERIYIPAMKPNTHINKLIFIDPDSKAPRSICSVENVRISDDGKSWQEVAVNPER